MGLARHAKLILFLTLLAAASQWGCIGRQPPQQGTWSHEDHFQHKSTRPVKDDKHQPG